MFVDFMATRLVDALLDLLWRANLGSSQRHVVETAILPDCRVMSEVPEVATAHGDAAAAEVVGSCGAFVTVRIGRPATAGGPFVESLGGTGLPSNVRCRVRRWPVARARDTRTQALGG